ncbi:MBL fold metallo-hydrolase [Micromonospora sp. IBHARD004]|uniref:MBL fold metallo-hydrolase n=1 Tax=Micromonospora sp. IBHARD004 TaxID=3457764 RepID=UPI0040590A51
MTDDLIDFVSAAPAKGSLAVRWNHGVPSKRRDRDPKIQVHAYDEHTIILRQSKATSYEAPFLFLLFGNERALLLDTGATADSDLFPLRATVDGLIAEWLDAHPRERYELVVAHSHGHGDHVAADAQFAGRPNTTVVPREVDAVRSFFGFGDSWPAQTVTLDLGGRALEILGSPGHHQAAITIYDPWTGILLTGDTALPGRLYAFDAAAYLATLNRLVAFAATRPVTHVLGCHIEMRNRPGRDYPLGAEYQPDERALQLTAGHLTAIRDAAASAVGHPGVRRFDDFILYTEPRKRDLLKLLARARAYKLAAIFRR